MEVLVSTGDIGLEDVTPDGEEARTVMGEAEAGVGVACLLQRSSTILSAGGYLRELTRKAGEGEF